MDRKAMIFIHLITLVFASTKARTVLRYERGVAHMDTIDDEDYDETSGEMVGVGVGLDNLFGIKRATDHAKDSAELSFDSNKNSEPSDDSFCGLLWEIGIKDCHTVAQETTSTYHSTASEATNSVYSKATTKSTLISKNVIETTVKIGKIGVGFDASHSTDSSDDGRLPTTLPRVSMPTDVNAITRPAKRQSTTKIDTTRAPLMAQTESSDAFLTTETKRVAKTLTSSANTQSRKTERMQGSTRKRNKIAPTSTTEAARDTLTTSLKIAPITKHSMLATKTTTETSTTTPTSPPNDALSTSSTRMSAETTTTTLSTLPNKALSTNAAKTNTETTIAPSMTVSNGTHPISGASATKSSISPLVILSRSGQDDDDGTETAINRIDDFDVIVPERSVTTTIVSTVNALPADSKKAASSSAETITIHPSSSTGGEVGSKYFTQHQTTSNTRPSQHHATESFETVQHAGTSQPDFDVAIKRIVETQQTARSALSRAPTITEGSTLSDLILTVTTTPPEAPSRKKPLPEEAEAPFTAFPTTILVICVVAAIIVIVIIIVLIVIIRGRMNKSGKYNITSEMNSVVGDESGSPGDAKVVKVHYNDTKA